MNKQQHPITIKTIKNFNLEEKFKPLVIIAKIGEEKCIAKNPVEK